MIFLKRCLSWWILHVVPGLVTASSHCGLKLSLLEVEEGLPSVSSNCQTWTLPTVMYLEQSFFSTVAWFLGGSPPPPPSILLHPPSSILHSLCFCLSGPVPISKPWGVDSSIHENWGLYACPGSCFFLLKKLKVLRESCCLEYRWASIKEVFIQNIQPPQAMVWYTAEHKQGFKWSSFHPEHQGWRG